MSSLSPKMLLNIIAYFSCLFVIWLHTLKNVCGFFQRNKSSFPILYFWIKSQIERNVLTDKWRALTAYVLEWLEPVLVQQGPQIIWNNKIKYCTERAKRIYMACFCFDFWLFMLLAISIRKLSLYIRLDPTFFQPFFAGECCS